MKLILKIVLYALALLSILAGTAKALQMPQEVSFFAQAGLGVIPLVLLGVLQIAAGILSAISRFRRLGLILVVVGFAASVLVIAMTGQIAFAVVSTLPVLIGLALLLMERKSGFLT